MVSGFIVGSCDGAEKDLEYFSVDGSTPVSNGGADGDNKCAKFDKDNDDDDDAEGDALVLEIDGSDRLPIFGDCGDLMLGIGATVPIEDVESVLVHADVAE